MPRADFFVLSTYLCVSGNILCIVLGSQLLLLLWTTGSFGWRFEGPNKKWTYIAPKNRIHSLLGSGFLLILILLPVLKLSHSLSCDSDKVILIAYTYGSSYLSGATLSHCWVFGAQCGFMLAFGFGGIQFATNPLCVCVDERPETVTKRTSSSFGNDWLRVKTPGNLMKCKKWKYPFTLLPR